MLNKYCIFAAAIAVSTPALADTFSSVYIYERRDSQFADVLNESSTPGERVSGTGGNLFPDVSIYGRAVTNYGRIRFAAEYSGQMAFTEADQSDPSYEQPNVFAGGGWTDNLTITTRAGSTLAEGDTLTAISRLTLSGILRSSFRADWSVPEVETLFSNYVTSTAFGSLFADGPHGFYLDAGTFPLTSSPPIIDQVSNSWYLPILLQQQVQVGSSWDMGIDAGCTLDTQAEGAPQTTTINASCGPTTMAWRGMTFIDSNGVDRTGELDAFGASGTNWALSYGGPGGVPEPAAWAMMIAGFGIVGSSLRRRRHMQTV